jgi:outer membrane immunogenic protein
LEVNVHSLKFEISTLVAAIALSTGIVAGSTQLHAADAPQAESYEPVAGTVLTDWSGAYIGAAVGGTWSNAENRSNSNSYDSNGVSGALYAGYNFQVDSWVLGLEADLSLAASGDSKRAAGPITDVYFSPIASARLRAGYALDSTLLYLTGGVAQGAGAVKSVSGATTKTESASHTGFVVGGGVEYAMSENWTLRGEYLYYGFGEEDYTLANGAVQKIDFEDAQTVRVGAAWKF